MPADLSVRDRYVDDYPEKATAFRLFEGEWSSDVPGFGLGNVALFDDDRVRWIGDQCGGFAGKKVLELGPLEGGHTYMMAAAGAKQITAIEANARAFLRCLVVQNALQFDAEFLLGDFRPYLRECRDDFDVVLAVGVLYHMTEPQELIADACRVSDVVGVWTHYYDRDVIRRRRDLVKRFEHRPRLVGQQGARLELYEQRYDRNALGWSGFCGGMQPRTYWATKESLWGLFDHLGFRVVMGHDHPDHPNGPAMLFVAQRREG